MTAATILMLLVTAERAAELWLARRNTQALLARGAREVGASHYPAIVLLHALWLASLWWFARGHEIHTLWLLAFLVLQGLRGWTLVTLGKRWTTRIIILPDAPLVRAGPYRFVSHPNYLVVVGEIAVLPLCFGLDWLALGFSLANIGMLSIRIRAENRALEACPDGAR